MIVFAAIVPHPPESIPGIGSSEAFVALQKTLSSFDKLAEGLERADPDTVVIISPHAHLEPYAFVVNSASVLKGSFSKFGIDEVYEYENNIDFADKLAFTASMNEIPTHLHESFLDHGALIPLYHLFKKVKPKVVHLSFSLMDYRSHYRYGEIIQKIIDAGGGRVAIIASGDLSHSLTPKSPAGFSPNAEEFDHCVLRYLGGNDLVSLMNMEEETVKEAAECGLRSIIVLLGALHEKKYNFELLSYEAPFGVGYLTARLL